MANWPGTKVPMSKGNAFDYPQRQQMSGSESDFLADNYWARTRAYAAWLGIALAQRPCWPEFRDKFNARDQAKVKAPKGELTLGPLSQRDRSRFEETQRSAKARRAATSH